MVTSRKLQVRHKLIIIELWTLKLVMNAIAACEIGDDNKTIINNESDLTLIPRQSAIVYFGSMHSSTSEKTYTIACALCRTHLQKEKEPQQRPIRRTNNLYFAFVSAFVTCVRRAVDSMSAVSNFTLLGAACLFQYLHTQHATQFAVSFIQPLISDDNSRCE